MSDAIVSVDVRDLMTRVAKTPTHWSGPDLLSAKSSLVFELDDERNDDVDRALKCFKGSDLEGDDVNYENFPISSALKELFDRVATEVHNGRGFAIVRGLNMAERSAEDSLIIFLAVANFIGDVRGIQDKKKNMISHITDSKNWKDVPDNLRHGIHTSTGLPFHNDMGADILALQVRQAAKKGGQTYLASVSRAVSELLKTDPQAAEALFEPTWPIQVSGSPLRYVFAPLVAYHEGHMMASLDPGRLGLHPATALAMPSQDDDSSTTAGIKPELTPAQQHALSALSAAAAKHQYCLDAETGDMIFINNWALLHARDSYEDNQPASGKQSNGGVTSNGTSTVSEQKKKAALRRHYVRLWLRNRDLAWAVPPNMAVPWEAAYGVNGDGHLAYVDDKTRLQYPVLPMPEYKIPRYSAGSAAFVLEDSDEEK